MIRLKRLSPILIVEDVEKSLRFWCDRLGFQVTMSLPDGANRIFFAAVENNGIELMIQSRQSVIAERPSAATELSGNSAALYLHVDDLDKVAEGLSGVEIVKARHFTAYGAEELYLREPGGAIVGFAVFR